MRLVEFRRDFGAHKKGERIRIGDEAVFAALTGLGVAVPCRPEAGEDLALSLVIRPRPQTRIGVAREPRRLYFDRGRRPFS